MAAPAAERRGGGEVGGLHHSLGCAFNIDPNERQTEGCPPEPLFVMLEQFRTG